MLAARLLANTSFKFKRGLVLRNALLKHNSNKNSLTNSLLGEAKMSSSSNPPISIEVEKDQYSTQDIAENYRLFLKSRESELRYVQVPSISKLLNNSLRGKRVVDFACGNGGSTRILADLEPDELVGVDLSPEQVKLAASLSSKEPKYAKIKYVAKDCAQPLELGQFDVVFSKHLLNYANSIETLKAMARAMFDATKPGNLCAGMMFNPAFKEEDYEKLHKYALDITKLNAIEVFIKMYDGDIKAGSKYLMNLRIFMWPLDEYDKAFAEAGFHDFHWVKLHLEADREGDHHLHHADFVKYEPLIMFKAMRPN